MNLTEHPMSHAARAALAPMLHPEMRQAPSAARHAEPREHAQPHQAPARLEAIWARSPSEVQAAQRLRHQVFVGEMGARLENLRGTPPGLDCDLYDAHCEHLLVHHADHGVVGTYRVLTPAAAQRVGGWYSEREFDLTRVRHLTPTMAELGRSCVHPEHRSGAVIMTLWAALAEFMVRNQLDTMIGCASISMRDGGHVAASVWEQLRQSHLAPIEHQVQPRLALPVNELNTQLAVETPALIKGYLRCGAKVLGAPAWDPDFNTADLPMMIRLKDLPERYRRHFMPA
ncbi:MAG: GNAT family N-acetyltransferase [Leptothrix sp. (in: b-proteobacteria)]